MNIEEATSMVSLINKQITAAQKGKNIATGMHTTDSRVDLLERNLKVGN